MTPEGIAKLKEHEGLRLRPYIDTTSNPTIGYGRNLAAKGISRDEAEQMLQCDIGEATVEALGTFPWFEKLDPVRQDVIVQLIFNLGIHGLTRFCLLVAAMEKSDFQAASYELWNSYWCHQVGRTRCKEMSDALELGRW